MLHIVMGGRRIRAKENAMTRVVTKAKSTRKGKEFFEENSLKKKSCFGIKIRIQEHRVEVETKIRRDKRQVGDINEP